MRTQPRDEIRSKDFLLFLWVNMAHVKGLQHMKLNQSRRISNPKVFYPREDEAVTTAGGEDLKQTSKILIINTGGTLSMKLTKRGYVPAPGFLESELPRYPQLQDRDQKPGTMPVSIYGTRVLYDIIEYDPILDSCNLTTHDWAKMASDIYKHYENYYGFVILQGTDTLAYSASTLSFMLSNLSKPVILTGAQIPLSEVRSDALDNLLGAMIFAGHFQIPEVCIYFHYKLLRGCRVRKFDSDDLDAFESSNMGPLAEVKTNIVINWNLVRIPAADEFSILTDLNRDVTVITLFPGISARTLRRELSPPLRGAVLTTFGAGNGPNNYVELLDAIREACERGVVIVNVTQCWKGNVVANYETGLALSEVGVVSGMDMTVEAALAKLGYLLACDYSVERIRELVPKNLRGELTEVRERQTFSIKDATFLKRMYSSILAGSVVNNGSGPHTPLSRRSSTRSDDGERGHVRGFDNDEASMQVAQRALLPTLLCSAAYIGAVEELQEMLQSGGKESIDAFNYDRRTPLHIAATVGRLNVVRLLIDNGANVNVLDRWNNSPLFEACRNDHRNCAIVLAEHGAKLRPDRAKLCYEIFHVVRRNQASRLHLFVDNGVDLAAVRDDFNNSVLHLVATLGDEYLPLLKLLVSEFKVPVDLRNDEGLLPYDVATGARDNLDVRRSFYQIVSFFEGYAADYNTCISASSAAMSVPLTSSDSTATQIPIAGGRRHSSDAGVGAGGGLVEGDNSLSRSPSKLGARRRHHHRGGKHARKHSKEY